MGFSKTVSQKGVREKEEEEKEREGEGEKAERKGRREKTSVCSK